MCKKVFLVWTPDAEAERRVEEFLESVKKAEFEIEILTPTSILHEESSKDVCMYDELVKIIGEVEEVWVFYGQNYGYPKEPLVFTFILGATRALGKPIRVFMNGTDVKNTHSIQHDLDRWDKERN